jgi:DNA-binding transcriptional ArsR family regulator/SAM-dependent methyltransferase
MSFDSTLRSLKAAADPTRLRLLAVLAASEATVGELQEILEQSQPRVSRHLRLLEEAGLLSKFRDGHWVYYRLASSETAEKLVGRIIAMAGEEPILDRDRSALTRVKRSRERDAYNIANLRKSRSRNLLGDRPDESAVIEVLEESSGEARFGDVLNVGCGDGALLCALGARARSVVGLDPSRGRRLLARSRVHQSGRTNCTIRNASLPELPFADDSFDLVVLSEVLGDQDHLPNMLAEAARVLRRDGRLIIIDRIQPAVRQLPQQTADRPLYENVVTARLGELGFRVSNRTWFPGRVMAYAMFSAVPEVTAQRTGTND